MYQKRPRYVPKRDQHMYQKRCLYIKRDPDTYYMKLSCISEETYTFIKTKYNLEINKGGILLTAWMCQKRPRYKPKQRSIYVWKEMFICQKRPRFVLHETMMYIRRDLYLLIKYNQEMSKGRIQKETYIQMKRDVWKSKET